MHTYIMRAIPGMGKSTFVKKVIPKLLEESGALPECASIFSADKYFVGEDGVYKFNRFKLGKAHQTCKDGFSGVFRLPMDFTPHAAIVDNTNISAKEIKFYYERAKKSSKTTGISIMELHPEDGDWDTVVERCIQGNVHNVPSDVITRMRDRFLSCKLPDEWESDRVKVLRGDGYFLVDGKRYDV